MTSEIDRLIATAQPRTSEVQVCARGDLVNRHAALVAEMQTAERAAQGSIGGDPDVARLAREIDDVQNEQEDSTVTLVVESVSRRAWADLLAKHPPRKQDRGLDHNPETFPSAVVALCTRDLTPEDAERLQDVLPAGEWGKLWNAAILLNVIETPHPKLSAATELVRANGASSTTRQNAASPGQSS